MANKKISDMAVMAAIDGTEHLVGVQGEVTEKALLSDVAAYVIDTITDLAPTSPATGYELMGTLADGTPKMFDLDAISAYAVASAWSVAADGVTAEGADLVIVDRSGTVVDLQVNDLVTFVFTQTPSTAFKTAVMDLSVLDADAALAGTELMLVATASDPNTATLTEVAAFVHAGFDTYLGTLDPLMTDGTPIADADTLFVSDSGTGKKISATELATYTGGKVSAGIVAAVFDGSSDTPIDSSVFSFETTGGTLKSCIGSVLGAYTEDYLIANAAVQATIDNAHKFLLFNGTDTETATGALLAAYVGDWLANNVTAIPVLASDHVMINDAGAMEKVLVSVLNTKMLDGSTAASEALINQILDLTSLSNGEDSSIDGTEYMLVGTGATPKWALLSALKAYVETDYDPQWNTISTDDYTSTPADANTLTMSDTSLMAIGLPLKYTIGGTDYFGIVAAVSANTSIDVRGATLATGDVTALYVGPPERAVTVRIYIGGPYLIPWNFPVDGLTSDILALIGQQYIDWQLADAYLVSVSGTHRTADGVANPHMNIKVGGSAVLTENTNKGFQLSTAGTWVRSSAVGVNLSNYKIESDDAIEVFCTAVAGTDGNAQDLSLNLTFVLE